MDWLKSFHNIWIEAGILSAIIVGMLLFIVSIIHIFKIKIPKNRMRYIYAFSSAFLIITAIVGQWVTARHKIFDYFEHVNEANGAADTDPTMVQTLIGITILVGGVIIGTLLAFSIKKLSAKSIHPEFDGHAHAHGHAHIIDNTHEQMKEIKEHNSKKSLIYMILTHRLPAGLILGILLVNFTMHDGEFALPSLIAFILHIIPELVIIYFARLDAGYSRKNSFLFSIGVKLLLIPFIFLGVALTFFIPSEGSEATFWIMPLLLAIAGLVMIWGAVFELAPSFVDSDLNNSKETLRLAVTFMSGAAFSMAIQFIHSH